MSDTENTFLSPEEKSPEKALRDVAEGIAVALPAIVPTLDKLMNERTAAIREHNQVQGALWEKALILEAVFIGAVLVGGFAAATALALSGQTASAEKIAFALFGFLGGRGFLHIRGLISSGTKK